jgi:hypothetical protein
MAKITQERSEQIGEELKLIVDACNSIEEDELAELIHIGEMKHTWDSMIDPTRYRLESKSITQSQKVLGALLNFKKEVKGIGAFK